MSLRAVRDVTEVGSLRIWSVSTHRSAATAHIQVGNVDVDNSNHNHNVKVYVGCLDSHIIEPFSKTCTL